jgi:hypothetical protein
VTAGGRGIDFLNALMEKIEILQEFGEGKTLR